MRFDEKHNFLESFRRFSKIFIRILLKMNYFAYFHKTLTNHALIFRAFGRKNQIVGKFCEKFENFWWKFQRKIEFFILTYIFRKFPTKNRDFGNNTLFLQHFFGFGGCDFPIPPWLCPWKVHAKNDGNAKDCSEKFLKNG